MTFSSAVLCGNRLYCWNTMPTLRRSASLSSFGSFTSCPSTVIDPLSIGTSALTQRSSVDLPEPDGPMMQITCRFITSIVMPLSTSLPPNVLCTSFNETSGWSGVQVIAKTSLLHREALFERERRARDRVAIDEEPQQQIKIHRHQQFGARFG